MRLTKTDKIIIDAFASAMDVLSNYLGSAFELTLHSLEDYNHSVVKICNGYHSGRIAGAPLTDLALNMLKRIELEGHENVKTYESYFSKNRSGDHLKSSTIPIYGENHRLIGLFCINLYMDTPFHEILHTFIEQPTEERKDEFFAQNIGDVFAEAVSAAKMQVMCDAGIAAVNKNREIIRILHERGFFNVKGSVMQVAEILGISKNTVYLHLRSVSS